MNEKDKQAEFPTGSTTGRSAQPPIQATEPTGWDAWYARLQQSGHWDQNQKVFVPKTTSQPT